jgi:hypothetical protein
MTVNGLRLSVIGKVLALVLCIGALPFVDSASAYAQEAVNELTNEGVNELANEGVNELANEGKKEESKWLDDYSQPVGFTYGVNANLNSAYLWRGLYAGGPNIQASANIGYGGGYIGVWCNLGVEGWVFKRFQPEVDISIGFNRWGLNVFLLYIHNFNCGFFDFNNYTLDDGIGNRLELDVRYTVSSKIPLSFLWATRLSAADGYINEAGEVVRAWSSYAELSYTQKLPLGLSLYGAVGITPWRSGYTAYERGFSVVNVDVRLRKDWSISTHCGMMLMGQITLNPSEIALNRTSIYWHPINPWKQSINLNVTYGIYLK